MKNEASEKDSALKLEKRNFLKIVFEKIGLEGATWRSATWHQLWSKV